MTDILEVDKAQSLKIQNKALKTIVHCLEEELKYHRERSRDYHIAIESLDSERQMNSILTKTIDSLLEKLSK